MIKYRLKIRFDNNNFISGKIVPLLYYVIQKRFLHVFWLDITDGIADKELAYKYLDELNLL